MINYARLLLYEAASGEDSEIGNSLHSVARRQLRITLRVDLQHNGSSCHLCSRTFNFGSRHVAGSAPGSPEVYQHRNASIANNFVELPRIDFQWLI